MAFPSLAAAQICAGAPSFDQGRYRISFGGVFNSDAKAFTLGLGMGGRTLFGDLSATNVRFDNLGAAAYAVGLSAGTQLTLGAARRVQICPIGSVGYVFGPADIDVFGDGTVVVDLAEFDVTLGLALGVLATRSTDPIIPTVSFAVANSTLRSTEHGTSTSSSTSETYGLVGLGVTFIFSRTIGLHLGASTPVGLDRAKASYGLSVSVNFGKKSENP